MFTNPPLLMVSFYPLPYRPPPLPSLESFLKVVDNPRFGVGHTLRVIVFLAFVLFACIRLALIGWGEFYDWGEGPLGRILLSPDYSIRPGDDGIGLDGVWAGPGRGGLGFSLFLLSDLLFISLDVGLTIFKYLINLLDLLRDNNSVSVLPVFL